MLLIDCPFCGPRAELEFTCGGESHIAPARPIRTAMSDAEWADYLFMRKNPKGLHTSAGTTPAAAGAGSTSPATR